MGEQGWEATTWNADSGYASDDGGFFSDDDSYV